MGGFIFNDKSYKIIGIAQTVLNNLGAGYPESDYAKAFCYELRRQGFVVIMEYKTNFVYNGVVLRKKRIDLMVDDEIVIELKVCSPVLNAHINQLVGYLKQTKKKTGLLIYFNNEGVKVKRVVN